MISPWRALTPAQDIVPAHLLLLHEHGHDDEGVQVDPLTQHPEVVTAHGVEIQKLQHLAAGLQRQEEPHFTHKQTRQLASLA